MVLNSKGRFLYEMTFWLGTVLMTVGVEGGQVGV
jgi:hypothetical protein